MIPVEEQRRAEEDCLSDSATDGDLQVVLRALLAERNALILAKYPRSPADWCERLPTPETYYRGHVSGMRRPNARGWAVGLCPFHNDQQELAVKFVEGTEVWCCLAGCGLGDRIDFHQHLSGGGFESAVLDLLGVPV
ncbi:hypothetical protein [Lysobacter sp. F6437]|uniref:hypothetical protein n=1 Tax=Lysobacter sp. F6437 TaxID=3459296 RepID=UPI00403E0C7F